MTESSSSSNKRIAKNTMMLYIRMLLTMGVSLYTSRVVLNTLGVEDYGVYNVVGGFVAMFGFMNNAMTSATQRFLSFKIGEKDSDGIRNVLSMSLNIHFIIAFVILVLAETVGLWFLNTQLKIPAERIVAAYWVYQFSILTLIVNIISVPYTSIIVAYERMHVFAGISIIEVSLKLLIVFMLQWFGFDKLKFYAVLIFSVALVIRLIYGVYCNREFKESKFRLYWNNHLFKQLFNHVGWMLFGTSAQMISGQGVNMLMNIFFDVTVNAARGIAYQIQGAVHSFVVNFMIAVRPQIIKNYAQQNFKEMYSLVFTASKFSYYLLFYISLPVLLLTETVLQWWLKILPANAVVFTKLIIIDLFFTVLFTSITTVSQATGKIKSYQLVVSFSFILVFIFTYLFFKLGFPSYYAFIIMIAMSFLSLIGRLIILKKQISFPVIEYSKEVLLKIILVTLVSLPLPLVILHIIKENTIQFFFVSFVSVISTTAAIWFVGISREEKYFVKNKSHQIIVKIKKLKYK
jgi:O-antigen/teichoic acid export membrane protein